MKRILVTGSAGFIGSHVCLSLRRAGAAELLEFDRSDDPADLRELVAGADAVIHLAGVNRPKVEAEFDTGNAGLTSELCAALAAAGRLVPLVMSSTIQVVQDNPYGRSKRAAEEAVLAYHRATNGPVSVFRLPNVFGKWSQPNYNTVVATFCHNISRGLPVTVSDPEAPLRFVYIDDVVTALVAAALNERPAGDGPFAEVAPVHSIKLGELHDLIVSFRDVRERLLLPDLGNPLVKALYSTYLSFLDKNDYAYPANLNTDARGWLFELVKSGSAGQMFVSRTKPGITRGNHYHDTKVEKFCVIQGRGVIRFRHVLGREVIEYPVNDHEIKVVDIPPGMTHSIENVGDGDMITLFWASEIFDPEHPDTYWLNV